MNPCFCSSELVWLYNKAEHSNVVQRLEDAINARAEAESKCREMTEQLYVVEENHKQAEAKLREAYEWRDGRDREVSVSGKVVQVDIRLTLG